MQEILTSGLIMILRADGGVAGTGFLISQDTAVTCTHVLAPAGSPVPEEAFIRFYGVAAPHKVVIDTKYCRPAGVEDIAFLTLVPPVTDKTPLLLGSASGTNGHEFDTFGFPSVNADGGVRGDGHVLGKAFINKIPVLQIDSKQVTPGFSGAPVLDKLTGRVIGMVTKIAVPDEYGRLRDVAFSTPSESLRAVLPALQIEDACPYRGLSSFTSDPEDVKFFCGRERLTSDLVAKLRKNPNFLAVVGPSGSGKSSVVNAGLVPAIRAGQAGFIPEKVSVFPLSKVSLDDVLAAANEINGAPRDGPGTRRTVFVLDELEQFFVTASKARESLIPELAKLVKDQPGFTVVTAFRSDFYDPVFNSALGPGLDNGQVNVRLMSLDELKSVIATPAASVGLRFSDGLVDDIAADAAKLDNPLPLLEFALTQLWEQRDNGELTRGAYRQMKGVAGSIAHWATDAFARLSEGERKTAQRILLRLIHYGDGNTPDTRKRAALADLVSASQDQAQVLSVVMKLATERILTTDRDESTRRQTVGLIHDALITQWEQLAKWIKEQREFLVWRQRFAARMEEWENGGKDDGGLLRGQALNDAIRWLGEHSDDLSPAESAFVEASVELRKSEEAAQKRQEEQGRRSAFRLRMGILAGGVAVVAILGAIWFWKASMRENALLHSRQLVEESQRIAFSRPSTALLLGVAALRATQGSDGADSAAAMANLHDLLERIGGSQVVARQKGVNAVAFSPDGKYFVSGQDDETVSFCPAADTGIVGCKSVTTGLGPVLFVGVGATNHWLVVGSSAEWKPQANGQFDAKSGILDNKLTVQLWDMTAAPPRALGLRIAEQSVHALSVSLDGKWLVTGEDKGLVHLWNLASTSPSQAPLEIPGHKYEVLSTAISPDGRWIATGDDDHVLVLSQLESGAVRKTFSFRQDEGRVSALAFSSDSALLALGTGAMLEPSTRAGDLEILQGNGTVKILDLSSGTPTPQTELTFITGDDQVDLVAISNDRRWLAAGSHSGWFTWEPRSLIKQNKMTLQVWKILDDTSFARDTMMKTRFRNLHRVASVLNRNGTLSFAFGTDNKCLISGGADGLLYLWDLVGDRVAEKALRFNGHHGPVTSLTGDRQLLVSGSLDGTVRRWTYGSRTLADYPRGVPGDEHGVRHIKFNKDGHWMASLSEFSTIRLWDMVNPSEPMQYGPFSVRVQFMEFSPEGRWLMWDWDSESRTKLVSLAGGSPLKEFDLPGEVIAVSNDDRWLVTSGRDKTLIWDLLNANFSSHPIEINTGASGTRFAVFDRDNRRLATIDSDGIVRFWNFRKSDSTFVAYGQSPLPNKVPQGVIALDQNWIVAHLNSTVGEKLAQAQTTPQGSDNTDHESAEVFKLDFEHGKLTERTLTQSETLPVQSAVISPDSRWLVTGLWIEVVFAKSGNDSYARLYDLQSDDPWKHSVVLRGHQNKLSAVTFSPDSRFLATGSLDGAVKLWRLDDIAEGKLAPTLTDSPEGQVTALEFDSESKRLLSASKDGTARVWYVSDTVASSPMVLSTSKKEVDQATASPRGDWIATSGDDLSGWLWPARPDKIIGWACKAAGNASGSELNLYLSTDEQRSLCPIQH